MNPSQARTVLRKVLAYCPSQSVDEYTPEAWAEALDDINSDDALEAVARIGRMEMEPGRSRYIEPGHIRAEVRRIRRDRLDHHDPPEPPPSLDTGQYLDWLRGVRRAIANGAPVEPDAIDAAPTAGHASRIRELISTRDDKEV